MNRLLQGDVGSGKTIVAVMALLTAVEAGCQAVLMAPTEILAEQHVRTVRGPRRAARALGGVALRRPAEPGSARRPWKRSGAAPPPSAWGPTR